MCECGAALPFRLHNPPPHWVHQMLPCCESSPPWLPIFAPPTSLDECFFFISLVVRLLCSLFFCQLWLFFVFKLLLSFIWLCEEAQCVYLCLHLGWKTGTKQKPQAIFLKISISTTIASIKKTNHSSSVHIRAHLAWGNEGGRGRSLVTNSFGL